MISYMFYPGDFLRDTAHLNELEDLFYRRLIDHYMMTEKPLPNDLIRIKRIVRCPKRGQKWLQKVLESFFVLGPEGYRNKRCDSELERIYKVSEKRKLAAEKRWSHRNANAYPNGSANAMQMECYPDPEPDINKPPISPITEDSKKSKKRPAQNYAPGFESFWKEYPKKIGKGMAYKAWQKLNPPLDVCLSALEWQKKSDQWKKDQGQFIPHPSTWLNAKRWEDEPFTQQSQPRTSSLAY